MTSAASSSRRSRSARRSSAVGVVAAVVVGRVVGSAFMGVKRGPEVPGGTRDFRSYIDRLDSCSVVT